MMLFGAYLNAQTGSSCSTAMPIYPAPLGDCDNTANIPGPGSQFGGQWQCPNELCGNTTAAGVTTVDGSCAGNDIGQCAYWMELHTGPGTTVNIENEGPYAGGPGSANNTKQYAVFSGTCGSLTSVGCYELDGNDNVTVTGLNANDIYYILVTPVDGNAACVFDACITSTTPYVPSVGQDCASATVLSSGVTVPGGVSNANASGGTGTGNASICEPPAGSIENSTWFVWTAPPTWVPGATAYINIYNQLCNSSAYGLQYSVYGAGETCGAFATSELCVTTNTVATQYFDTWIANPGETFYIITDGFAGIACEFDLQVNDAPIVLPIRLGEFYGDIKGQKIKLDWTTFSEKDNDYFTIEKSTDGKAFKVIGHVPGAGTSEFTNEYSIYDESPAFGVNYYRLIQTDFDGTKVASDVIAINYKPQGETALFPNPTNVGEVNLGFLSSENTTVFVNVNDLSGKRVKSFEIDAHVGNNNVLLDINGIKSGTYLIQSEGFINPIKLIIK